jgi:hypothetical protein
MRLTPSQKTPDNQQSKEQGTGTSASPMCRGCEQGAGMDFSCRGRGSASLLLLAVLPVPEFPWSSPVPGPAPVTRRSRGPRRGQSMPCLDAQLWASKVGRKYCSSTVAFYFYLVKIV